LFEAEREADQFELDKDEQKENNRLTSPDKNGPWNFARGMPFNNRLPKRKAAEDDDEIERDEHYERKVRKQQVERDSRYVQKVVRASHACAAQRPGSGARDSKRSAAVVRPLDAVVMRHLFVIAGHPPLSTHSSRSHPL